MYSPNKKQKDNLFKDFTLVKMAAEQWGLSVHFKTDYCPSRGQQSAVSFFASTQRKDYREGRLLSRRRQEQSGPLPQSFRAPQYRVEFVHTLVCTPFNRGG